MDSEKQAIRAYADIKDVAGTVQSEPCAPNLSSVGGSAHTAQVQVKLSVGKGGSDRDLGNGGVPAGGLGEFSAGMRRLQNPAPTSGDMVAYMLLSLSSSLLSESLL